MTKETAALHRDFRIVADEMIIVVELVEQPQTVAFPVPNRKWSSHLLPA
jgi:hypothetical protein